MRQEQPLRSRETMAFRISRFGYASGLPPGLASGTRWLIKAHAWSLRSVGYDGRVCMTQSYPTTVSKRNFLDTLLDGRRPLALIRPPQAPCPRVRSYGQEPRLHDVNPAGPSATAPDPPTADRS